MEPRYSTSSLGQVAFLMWFGIMPQGLTYEEPLTCLYYKDVNYADLIDKYWEGYQIPVCELAECVVVAERILRRGKIKKEWYDEMKEALEDLRDDYLIPTMF